MALSRIARKLRVVPKIEEFEPRLVLSIPAPAHVVIAIEENHNYNQIIGNSSAPYINSLATQGALMTSSHGIGHPSEPNYLEFFSGSNQGVTSDACPVGPFTTADLGGELIAKSDTFTGYEESLPSVGYTGCTAGGTNGYYRKHNPWVDFPNVPAADSQPFTSFPTDFTQLPLVSIVVPNEGDDMHNGTVAQGDTWLKNNLDPYVQFAKTNNSLFIVTWDEGSTGNHIPTIFFGPMVKPGQYSENINHYRMLRTIENMYGLPFAGASSSVAPIRDIWTTAPSANPATLATASLPPASQGVLPGAVSHGDSLTPSAVSHQLDAFFVLTGAGTTANRKVDTGSSGASSHALPHGNQSQDSALPSPERFDTNWLSSL